MTHIPDKIGSDLNQQRFQMLEDIAKDLAGDVVFPTCFDISVRIRRMLDDPAVSIDQVCSLVSVDPLISTKLLRLANSVAFNPAGVEIRDIKGAVSRLGMKTVCTTAMAIAMRQMLSSREIVGFSAINEGLWMHSLRSASAAHVLAKRLTRINPDEAFLAGLVHDLGAFYMLYRATQYPELRERPDTVRYLVMQWHESIGVSLLGALGLPQDIVDAAVDHDHLRPAPEPPRSLPEVVYLANLMAGSHFEWLHQDVDNELIAKFPAGPSCLALRDEIEAHALGVQAALA